MVVGADPGGAAAPQTHHSGNPRIREAQEAPRILIVAGEASGDLHAAKLTAALRRMAPRLRIAGMGGSAMRAAGVELLADASQTAVVGLTELWEKRRVLRQALRDLRETLERTRPALLICVDFPDFNLLLARTAHRLRIPVCYFISPQVWAWRRGRIRTIRRLVRKVLVLFPFEERLYREAGVDVTFVGHPLLDALAAVPPRESCRAALGLAGDRLTLGLLPGSRQAELRRHLPLLLGAAEQLRGRYPDLSVLVAVAPSLDPGVAEATLAASAIRPRILQGRTHEVIRAADVLLAVSGTVTLEAAILGTPMVITYRLGWLSWLVARLLVRVPYIGLPNLVAEGAVVPELIQFEARPERLADAALAILESPERLAQMRIQLTEIRTRLGSPGAADRAAKEVLALLPETATPGTI